MHMPCDYDIFSSRIVPTEVFRDDGLLINLEWNYKLSEFPENNLFN